MKALKLCANGCDKPPQPPSLVICKDCLKKVGDKLREIMKSLEDRSEG